MLIFSAFSGINNVVQPHRLDGGDLLQASDVNIGLTGEITRRAGFAAVSDVCHKNIFDGHAGIMYATSGSELVAVHPGGARYVIHPALGSQRVWYCNLPDGRTTFSNGLLHGITNGAAGLEHSVRPPDSLGAPDTAFGSLFAGTYRYHLTMRRLADGVESPAISSQPITISQGGVRLDGLVERAGHELQVYLSGKDGEGAYLIGATSGTTFEWGGQNSALVQPCRTVGAREFPVGTITAFWRGRTLVADGSTLWASRPSNPHLSDWRDFKPFTAPITLIQPVDDGIYVGTEEDLIWLGGTTWEGLGYVPTERGPVVMGSGVTAPGKQLMSGDGTGAGKAMLCIADGEIVAGFGGGATSSLTAKRYRTAVGEVCATFRVVDGIPQYVAVPQ